MITKDKIFKHAFFLCLISFLALLFSVSNTAFALDIEFTVKHVDNNSAVKITGANNIDSNITLVVPATYNENNNDLPVVDIAGFSENQYIVSLDLTQATNLTTISRNAFKDCSNLSGDISIPSSLTKISENAFSGTNIQNVFISNTLEINSTAFPETTMFWFSSLDDMTLFVSNNPWSTDRCSYKSPITVTQNTSNIPISFGETLNASVSTPGEYIWYLDDVQYATTQSVSISNLNVGNYILKCEIFDESLIETDIFNVTVSPLEVNISFPDLDLEYTESTQSYPFTSNVSNDYLNVSYYYFNQQTSQFEEIDNILQAGKYKISVDIIPTLSDNMYILSDNSKEFNVTPKKLTLDWLIPSTIDYETALTSNVCTSEYVSVSWTKNNQPAVIGVGDWTVVATLKPQYEHNYEILNPTKLVTITGSQIQIVWPIAQYTYSGELISLDIQLNGASQTVECIFSDNSTISATDFGNYSVLVTGLTNPNYSLPENASFTWNISKKVVRVNWVDIQRTYTGQKQTPYAYADGVILTVSDGYTNANEDDTPYTVTATTDDPNIELTNSTYSFHIRRANENFNMSETIEKKYDGNPVSFDIEYSGSRTIHYFVDDIEIYDISAVGDYTVNVKIYATQNYNEISKICHVKIYPIELKAEYNNLTVEVDYSDGFKTNAKLNITEQNPTDNIRISNLQKQENLKVISVINVEISGSETTTFSNLKISLKNVDVSKLKVYEVTSTGLKQCDFTIDNNYICLSNASAGTYAILREKGSWFEEKGIWLFTIVGSVAILSIILLMIFRKPLNERLEKQMLSAVEKVYTSNPQEYIPENSDIHTHDTSHTPIHDTLDDRVDITPNNTLNIDNIPTDDIVDNIADDTSANNISSDDIPDDVLTDTLDTTYTPDTDDMSTTDDITDLDNPDDYHDTE